MSIFFSVLPVWLYLLVSFAGIPAIPTGYVTDTSSVIPAAEKSALERRCAQLDASKRAQIAIVVVDSLEGTSIETAGPGLFRRWGVGRKGVNDGILVMLAVKEHKSRIDVGSGVQKFIPYVEISSAIESMKPDLRANAYGKALNLVLDRFEKLLPTSPR